MQCGDLTSAKNSGSSELTVISSKAIERVSETHAEDTVARRLSSSVPKYLTISQTMSIGNVDRVVGWLDGPIIRMRCTGYDTNQCFLPTISLCIACPIVLSLDVGGVKQWREKWRDYIMQQAYSIVTKIRACDNGGDRW